MRVRSIFIDTEGARILFYDGFVKHRPLAKPRG